MITRPQVRFEFIAFLLVAAWTLIGAAVEFYNIGWGTGVWLGQFALTWFAAFVLFVLFCIICFVCVVLVLWQPERLQGLSSFFERLRSQIDPVRWLVAAFLIFIPVYLLQYTFWGIVLHGPYLRILLTTGVVVMVGWLFTNAGFMRWHALLVSMLLVAAALALFQPFVEVTSYPFSLGWSEGNRLWDYSILYGRDRYEYPADQVIPVFLDIGRQFAGGVSFLIPGLNIWQARFWLALVDVVPYLLLGWVTFRTPEKRFLPWMLAGVWAFLFVRQGPIHPPLLLCAIAVAFAWRRPLWLAVPLIFAAAYFAQLSRYTWLFAPAMWAVMLEFAGARELDRKTWFRSISVGTAGLLGGYFAPKYLPVILTWMRTLGQPQAAGSGGTAAAGGGAVSISTIQTGLSSQPLIWSRLLPNETYGPGILFGLILAVVPLIVGLLYLFRSKNLQVLQKLSIVLPLLAFLVVGLIISVKIGGGGDLHNMDMFIVGLLFAAAILWWRGGYEWITKTEDMPIWMRVVMLALIALPAFKPLAEMRPLMVHKDIKFVATLADITPMDPLPNPLPDTIPFEEDTQAAMRKVQKAIDAAQPSGEILFMDQRQLLTFGYVEDLPLVPEYDKKLLIDMAMSNNAAYFETFYNDLAAHRFSLIITSPVNRRLDNEEGHFNEENNAWVKWVTKPLLCYYEPLDVLKKVDVELLVPRAGTLSCESEMP
jgi:hypothetical protein